MINKLISYLAVGLLPAMFVMLFFFTLDIVRPEVRYYESTNMHHLVLYDMPSMRWDKGHFIYAYYV